MTQDLNMYRSGYWNQIPGQPGAGSYYLGEYGYSEAVKDKIRAHNRAKLSQLTPATQAMMNKLYIDTLRETGLRLWFADGARSFAQQRTLFGKGRTVPGVAVTNAQAGFSWHNWNRALDVVPMLPSEQLAWNSKEFSRIGSLGKRIGLKWGGSWGSDVGHFSNQDTTLAKLRTQNTSWQPFIIEGFEKSDEPGAKKFPWLIVGGLAVVAGGIYYVYTKQKK